MLKYQQISNAIVLLKLCSFRKAAHSQNISQPAFSRSIANLENSLGVKLFHRHSTGVFPTVYGEILKTHGHRILMSVSDFEDQIRLTQKLGMGELKIVMGAYAAEISGHQAVGKLVSKFPDIRCKVTVTDWELIEKTILLHEADIGLAEISLLQSNKNLIIKPLYKHRFVLFCRSKHPILEKTQIKREDLIEYPLVLSKLPERLGSVFPGKLFPDKYTQTMIPSIEVQNTPLSRQIVVESDAISACVPIQIKRELSEGVFSIIPIYESWMTSNYGFVLAKDRAVLASAEYYMAFVKEIEKKVEIENEVLIKKYLSL